MSGLRIGSLFSGYEGLGMAVQSVLGGDIAWVSDIDPGACKILAHRYPDVPNLGDIERVGLLYSDEEWKEIKAAQLFHGAEYEMPVPDWSDVDPVDALTLGFPCTDVSCAGLRLGLTPTTRSGLWSYAAQAIAALHPPLVVIENVRGLLSASAHHPAHSDLEPCPWCVGDGGGVPLRALGAVLGDLADIGYDASWQGLRAADVGAPHGRFRVFVTAWPAEDAHGAARGERRLAASRQAEGGWPRADAGRRDRAPAADTGSVGRRAGLTDVRPGEPDARRGPAANTDRDGFGRLKELHGVPRAGCEGTVERDDADGLAVAAGGVDWGAYTAAVRRWERLTRPAPNPTERGKNGQPRLSPAFVEWMQGLPAGWVTDVPGLTRNEQLKALGNGVVPQQAAQALRLLLPDVAAAVA